MQRRGARFHRNAADRCDSVWNTGRRAPIASIEDALAYRFTKEEEAIADEFLLGAIIGGPQQVLEGLTTLARNSGADELMLSTLLPSREDRLQSYQRVSTVAGL